PHLVPMNRGEYLTSYCKLQAGKNVKDLHDCLIRAYADEPFIIVRDINDVPASRHVRGSNYCHISVLNDRIAGRAIVIATLDNLVKGSGGQGIQNMNIMMGFAQTCGLEQLPLTP
ncbi:MAG: Asd/ArgC dimerization domain-containing protein, partial [Pseudomonadota bacterium]